MKFCGFSQLQRSQKCSHREVGMGGQHSFCILFKHHSASRTASQTQASAPCRDSEPHELCHTRRFDIVAGTRHFIMNVWREANKRAGVAARASAVRSTCEQWCGREYDEPALLICAVSETLARLGDQDPACCASAGARACGEMEKKGGGDGWCGKMKRNPYDGGLFSKRDADVSKREAALRQPPCLNPRLQRSQRLRSNDG